MAPAFERAAAELGQDERDVCNAALEEPALLGERTEGRPTRRRLSTKSRAMKHMKQSTAG
jgi:hypothetical protein